MIDDYLIPQEGHDWGTLLAPWADLLPEDFTLWMVNRIGDAIVVTGDGSVHLLDVGAGDVTRLADNRDEFIVRVDQDGNADVWLAIALVDRFVEAGLELEPGRCYGFVTPPLLGGEYTVDNIRTLPIDEHYGFLGSIYEQTKDLPDGTDVRLVISE